MSFITFAAIAIILFLFIMYYFNLRRNAFFKSTAQKYNLQFQKLNVPSVMQAQEAYPVRKLEGSIQNNRVLVEDTVSSTIPTFFSIANLLPSPLFGDAGWSKVRTKFFINGQEQIDVYLKEGNYVASKSTIESFLKKLS